MKYDVKLTMLQILIRLDNIYSLSILHHYIIPKDRYMYPLKYYHIKNEKFLQYYCYYLNVLHYLKT